MVLGINQWEMQSPELQNVDQSLTKGLSCWRARQVEKSLVPLAIAPDGEHNIFTGQKRQMRRKSVRPNNPWATEVVPEDAAQDIYRDTANKRADRLSSFVVEAPTPYTAHVNLYRSRTLNLDRSNNPLSGKTTKKKLLVSLFSLHTKHHGQTTRSSFPSWSACWFWRPNS